MFDFMFDSILKTCFERDPTKMKEFSINYKENSKYLFDKLKVRNYEQRIRFWKMQKYIDKNI